MKNLSANPFFSFENGSLPLGFEVPDVSLFGMLKITAENQPDSLAYEYFGTKCTYRNLIKKIEEMSKLDLGEVMNEEIRQTLKNLHRLCHPHYELLFCFFHQQFFLLLLGLPYIALTVWSGVFIYDPFCHIIFHR